jgi:hypothetical protein
VRGAGSRIAGRGSVLRTLRAVIRRLERYDVYRATTTEEHVWAARLHDELSAAFNAAVAAPGAASSLRMVDERRRVSSKTAGRNQSITSLLESTDASR